jgi:uncharacterized RDD family membrane protein YckC
MSNQLEQIDWMHWIYRLIALIIDGIIVGIVAIIISAVLALAFIFGGGFGYFFAGLGFLFFSFIWGILLVLYFTILDVSWGATIGKRLMGLHVQMLNGGKVPFDKALIRNISKIFWPLLILDWLIGIVTPGDKRQKYTDRIAGTVVIQLRQAFQTNNPPPYNPPPPPPPS